MKMRYGEEDIIMKSTNFSRRHLSQNSSDYRGYDGQAT